MPGGFCEKKKRFVKYLQIVSKINTIKVDKGKVIPKLSTGKNPQNAVKWTYTQSYPLYPQKSMWRTLIYITQKETNVLYISDKSYFLWKYCGKLLDNHVVE